MYSFTPGYPQVQIHIKNASRNYSSCIVIQARDHETHVPEDSPTYRDIGQVDLSRLEVSHLEAPWLIQTTRLHSSHPGGNAVVQAA